MTLFPRLPLLGLLALLLPFSTALQAALSPEEVQEALASIDELATDEASRAEFIEFIEWGASDPEQQIRDAILDPETWEADFAAEMAEVDFPWCTEINAATPLPATLTGPDCYFLSSNLNCAAATGTACLTMQADTRLYMRGHNMTGTGTNGDVAILLEGDAKVIGGLFNATLSNFQNAVVMQGSNNTVKHLTVSNNTNIGIILKNDDMGGPINNNAIKFIKAHGNDDDGININVDGASAVSHNRVRFVVSTESQTNGIFARGTAAGDIEHNYFSHLILDNNGLGGGGNGFLINGMDSDGNISHFHLNHAVASHNSNGHGFSIDGINAKGGTISNIHFSHLIANDNAGNGILLDSLIADGSDMPTDAFFKDSAFSHFIANHNEESGIVFGFLRARGENGFDTTLSNMRLSHFIANANSAAAGAGIVLAGIDAINGETNTASNITLSNFLANRNNNNGVSISNIAAFNSDMQNTLSDINVFNFIAKRNGNDGVSIDALRAASTFVSTATNDASNISILNFIGKYNKMIGINLQSIGTFGGSDGATSNLNLSHFLATYNDNVGISLIRTGSLSSTTVTNTNIRFLHLTANHNARSMIGDDAAGILFLQEIVDAKITHLSANHNGSLLKNAMADGIRFGNSVNSGVNDTVNNNSLTHSQANGNSRHGIVAELDTTENKFFFNVARLNGPPLGANGFDILDKNPNCDTNNIWGLNLITSGLIATCPDFS